MPIAPRFTTTIQTLSVSGADRSHYQWDPILNPQRKIVVSPQCADGNSLSSVDIALPVAWTAPRRAAHRDGTKTRSQSGRMWNSFLAFLSVTLCRFSLIYILMRKEKKGLIICMTAVASGDGLPFKQTEQTGRPDVPPVITILTLSTLPRDQ